MGGTGGNYGNPLPLDYSSGHVFSGGWASRAQPHDTQEPTPTMPSERPAVSILMPTHNGAAFVSAAVESVQAQTFGDFELIISDDSSEDGTPRIVARMRDPRIRVVSERGARGFGANWNRCLREARGALIKLLPQDDLLAPDCLAKQVEAMRADLDQSLALTFCARQVIGPDGKAIARRRLGPLARHLSRKEVLARTCRSGTNPIGEPGAVLFRRAAADRAGLFDDRRPFVIDIDYWLRLLEHGDALYLPEAMSSFRISVQSHSVRIAGEQARQFAGFLREARLSHPSEISRADLVAGRLMGLANAAGRSVFYAVALRR